MGTGWYLDTSSLKHCHVIKSPMMSLWRHSNFSLGFGFLKLFEFLQFVIKWLKITEDTFRIGSISHEDHIVNFNQWLSISTFPKFSLVNLTYASHDPSMIAYAIEKQLTKPYQKLDWNYVFVFLQFQHSHEQPTNQIRRGKMNGPIHKMHCHQPTMKNNWSHPRCKCVGEPKYSDYYLNLIFE